jgi:hypothetical protein
MNNFIAFITKIIRDRKSMEFIRMASHSPGLYALPESALFHHGINEFHDMGLVDAVLLHHVINELQGPAPGLVDVVLLHHE